MVVALGHETAPQNFHVRTINLVWQFHLYEAVSEGIWSAGVSPAEGIAVRYHHIKQETSKKLIVVARISRRNFNHAGQLTDSFAAGAGL
jgi:flagellar biosynthesis protein FliP